MSKKVFATILASLTMIAASCSSDMPSIKRFQIIALLPILVITLLPAMRRRTQAV